jgi:hypothetical protein
MWMRSSAPPWRFADWLWTSRIQTMVRRPVSRYSRSSPRLKSPQAKVMLLALQVSRWIQHRYCIQKSCMGKPRITKPPPEGSSHHPQHRNNFQSLQSSNILSAFATHFLLPNSLRTSGLRFNFANKINRAERCGSLCCRRCLTTMLGPR